MNQHVSEIFTCTTRRQPSNTFTVNANYNNRDHARPVITIDTKRMRTFTKSRYYALAKSA